MKGNQQTKTVKTVRIIFRHVYLYDYAVLGHLQTTCLSVSYLQSFTTYAVVFMNHESLLYVNAL